MVLSDWKFCTVLCAFADTEARQTIKIDKIVKSCLICLIFKLILKQGCGCFKLRAVRPRSLLFLFLPYQGFKFFLYLNYPCALILAADHCQVLQYAYNILQHYLRHQEYVKPIESPGRDIFFMTGKACGH